MHCQSDNNEILKHNKVHAFVIIESMSGNIELDVCSVQVIIVIFSIGS